VQTQLLSFKLNKNKNVVTDYKFQTQRTDKMAYVSCIGLVLPPTWKKHTVY